MAYQELFSCYSSSKAGARVLFNNNFNSQIQKAFCDPGGRFIVCDIKVEQMNITLANIYTPNNDEPVFFQRFFEQLQDFSGGEIIIGEDLNLVLDINKDKKGGLAKTHQKCAKVVQENMHVLDLADAWRTLNQEEQKYTWREKNPEIHCRLDLFLVSQTILNKTMTTDILPGYKTDHSMMSLSHYTQTEEAVGSAR